MMNRSRVMVEMALNIIKVPQKCSKRLDFPGCELECTHNSSNSIGNDLQHGSLKKNDSESCENPTSKIQLQPEIVEKSVSEETVIYESDNISFTDVPKSNLFRNISVSDSVQLQPEIVQNSIKEETGVCKITNTSFTDARKFDSCGNISESESIELQPKINQKSTSEEVGEGNLKSTSFTDVHKSDSIRNVSESESDPFAYSSEDYIPNSDYSSEDDSTSSCYQNSEVDEEVSAPAHSPITPTRTVLLNQCVSIDAINDTPLTRKRKRNPNNWERNKLKQLRNSGKAFISKTGKVNSAKQMRDGCTNCMLKCRDTLTFEDRSKIFESFYKLADKTRQWSFILENSKEVNKKLTKVLSGNSRRSCSRQYFLYRIIDCKKESIRVCFKTFTDTLAINSQWIETAYKRFRASNLHLLPDKRGTFIRKMNPETEEIRTLVRDHINSIPAIESHYLRQQTTKKYIDGDLSIAKMHRLYLEWLKNIPATSCAIKHKSATLRQYRDIFNSEFNIGFHLPKKDQCEECHQFNNLSESERASVQLKHEMHLHHKQKARNLKYFEKQNAIESESTIAACFDFQKVLSVPTADISVFYYKRKLSVCSFTIYNMATRKAKCFVWDETIAKKGANEVISCLYHYIKSEITNNISQFNFWSDNCYGQNKNRIVFGGYAWLCKILDVNISHKFLEKGHTQNEGDNVHSIIEREKKRKTIYTPEQWYSLIRNCRTEESSHYDVMEMTQSDFFNFRSFSSQLNTVKNTVNEKVCWTQIRQVDVLKDSSNMLQYKYSFDEEPKQIMLYKNENTHPRARKKFKFPDNIPICYTEQLPISKEKLNDLRFLRDRNYIPRLYHTFYDKLTCDNHLPENQIDSD